MHRKTERFQKCLDNLPAQIQELAKKNFILLKANPRHPSLQFKKIGMFWSIRIGIRHRALATKDAEGFIWVWIGDHEEYDRLIRE